ncbi:translation factor Sua5 [Tepiditoga spiralis]|uniref:Threonylcarbamoyl-AMP synthase n=1 Tax=Tepiditoga spiralis TaxID=2108365 RepID=A0A7G1G901_9BACT|nr:L-threonylcarbamoyladenylate synthase [Tepiditoga spiralis]BBE31403.1 translation factor Sua5 [Tepiditoga spiralis]
MTKIFNIDSLNLNNDKLKEAGLALKNGKTVIFPTETVYGLGANGLDETAIKKIYKAKGRPSDNPLILHLSNVEDIKKYAYINEELLNKIKKITPGPITFVLIKKEIVPDIVTANRETVAIRIPAHPIARELIKNAGVPIAAPSANISGKPSLTRSKDVIEEMNNRVDYIITSDDPDFGLESTVIDLTKKNVVLLRPGPISPEKLKDIFGKIEVPDFIYGKKEADIAIAPGMKYRHYSPEKPVILVKDFSKDFKNDIKNFKKPVFFILKENLKFIKNDGFDYEIIDKNYFEFAVKLFALLRKYDKTHDAIIIESLKDEGIGIAIMNRLRKAASKII